MSFIKRNTPETIDELVFANEDIKEIILDYANGGRSGNLILHGPPGSGKSQAALAIVRSRLDDLQNTLTFQMFHGSSLDHSKMTRSSFHWGWQFMYSDQAWALIDEIDMASDKVLKSLRDFMDNGMRGHIICTTNHIHKLDDAFVDRFQKVHITHPPMDRLIDRATTILRSEGHDICEEQVKILLEGFGGSIRDLMRELEHYHNKLSSS